MEKAMSCTLNQARALVRKADAKKNGKAQLKKAAAQTKRTVACAGKAAVKGHKAAAGFKATVRAANRQGFQQRLATLPKATGADAAGRALHAALALARG